MTPQHAEHQRRGQARDPESEAEQHALRDGGEAEAQEHGAGHVGEVLLQQCAPLALDRQQAHHLLRQAGPSRSTKNSTNSIMTKLTVVPSAPITNVPPEDITSSSTRCSRLGQPPLQLHERSGRCAASSQSSASPSQGICAGSIA